MIQNKDDKLLVFFAGYDSTGENDWKLVTGLAGRIGAVPMTISGRYPFLNDRNRTQRHYDIYDGRHIPGDKYDMARREYADKITMAMFRQNIQSKNVILMGRDQGAFMAVQMAYRNSGIFPRGVIALDGYYLNDASFGKIGKDDIYSASPPLIWINTPDTRRIIAPGCESPQPLIDAGVNVSKINLKNTDYALAKGNMRHILWAMGETGIRPRKKER